ncbi:MAG: CDP-diacylglycerol--serine O-phosphatidyltransferase, partial [Bdellovibrionota bacterium]
MRKIYIVPNLVTTMNMACGFYSMIASTDRDFTTAAWAIIAAGVFDGLDGRIARLAKATSDFGVEYDSLSDLVSFGMAPALLLFMWHLDEFGRLGWLASFLFMTCAALRLARFNVSTETVPKGFFQGLPTPGAAGVVATFVIFNFATDLPADMETVSFLSLGLAFALATLMVSSVRFPSFKDFNWRSKATFGYLLIGVLAAILVATHPEI